MSMMSFYVIKIICEGRSLVHSYFKKSLYTFYICYSRSGSSGYLSGFFFQHAAKLQIIKFIFVGCLNRPAVITTIVVTGQPTGALVNLIFEIFYSAFTLFRNFSKRCSFLATVFRRDIGSVNSINLSKHSLFSCMCRLIFFETCSLLFGTCNIAELTFLRGLS